MFHLSQKLLKSNPHNVKASLAQSILPALYQKEFSDLRGVQFWPECNYHLHVTARSIEAHLPIIHSRKPLTKQKKHW